MRKFVVVMAATVLSVASGGVFAHPVQIEGKVSQTIFASASMQTTMKQIAKLYTQTNPDLEILYNFDLSGTFSLRSGKCAVCEE